MVFSDNVTRRAGDPAQGRGRRARPAGDGAGLRDGGGRRGRALGFANVVAPGPGRGRRRVRNRGAAGALACWTARGSGCAHCLGVGGPGPVRRGRWALDPAGAAAAGRRPDGRADRAGVEAARARGRGRDRRAASPTPGHPGGHGAARHRSAATSPRRSSRGRPEVGCGGRALAPGAPTLGVIKESCDQGTPADQGSRAGRLLRRDALRRGDADRAPPWSGRSPRTSRWRVRPRSAATCARPTGT